MGEMKPFEFVLGSKVRDIVTGFCGVVTAQARLGQHAKAERRRAKARKRKGGRR